MGEQRKCRVCGTVYDLTPVYGYDSWNLGHYGCNSPIQYVENYRDDGCPICKYREREIKREKIKEYNKNICKCYICGKGEIVESNKNKYYIECDCIRTIKEEEFDWIPKLIEIWNRCHRKSVIK